MSSAQDVINYVMHTPHNANPAVLASMLQGFDGGNGGVVVGPDEPTSESAVMWLKTTLNEQSEPVSIEIRIKNDGVWEDIPLTSPSSMYVGDIAPANEDAIYWLDTGEDEN